jgi:hypothetical protein
MHIAHEGLVDLQLVDREARQVGQAGIAGAEIVDRQLEAQRAQACSTAMALPRLPPSRFR